MAVEAEAAGAVAMAREESSRAVHVAQEAVAAERARVQAIELGHAASLQQMNANAEAAQAAAVEATALEAAQVS